MGEYTPANALPVSLVGLGVRSALFLCMVMCTMPWEIVSAILALALFIGIALLARRLLAKSDEYESEGKPTLADLWSRGGGGDPGPGG